MSAAPEGRLLTEKSYTTLLRQIESLVQDAHQKTSSAKVDSTWHIGRRITAARLSAKAGYHNTVLRDLAADLGVSKRILQEAVTFFDAYEEPPTGAHLNWSHYRQLMRLPKKERTPFEKLATKNRWSARELSTALVEFSRQSPAAESALPRPTDPTYLYRATITGVVDGDTIDVDIDLGFEVTRHARLRLAHVDAPDLQTEEGRAARDYLHRSLHKAQTAAIVTDRLDLHGRYVVHLFTSPQPLPTLDCFQHGKYENAALLDAGHATLAPG